MGPACARACRPALLTGGMNRITFAGKISSISQQQMYLDGTAMLIVVGVALDTMRQMPTQLFIRGYRGFIR